MNDVVVAMLGLQLFATVIVIACLVRLQQIIAQIRRDVRRTDNWAADEWETKSS